MPLRAFGLFGRYGTIHLCAVLGKVLMPLRAFGLFGLQ